MRPSSSVYSENRYPPMMRSGSASFTISRLGSRCVPTSRIASSSIQSSNPSYGMIGLGSATGSTPNARSVSSEVLSSATTRCGFCGTSTGPAAVSTETVVAPSADEAASVLQLASAPTVITAVRRARTGVFGVFTSLQGVSS